MGSEILYGFKIATTPENLLLCFLGVLLGTLVGVLPGIGPAGAMALLLPVSLKITPVGTFIMLAGIYYGSMYGGSTTSILVSIPGEPSSVMTCVDGYQMALQGRAGPALGISAIGSFIAGTISLIALMMVALPLAKAALKFGPPEFFCLVLMGLTLVTYLSQKSAEKAVMSALIGMLLSWVGLDLINGQSRFTFGIMELNDGVGVIPLVMGLFGISEVFMEIEAPGEDRSHQDEDQEPSAHPGGLAAVHRPYSAVLSAWLLPRHHSRRGRNHRKLHGLHHGETALQTPGTVRERERSSGWRLPSQPTTPQPQGPSFLSSLWGYP